MSSQTDLLEQELTTISKRLLIVTLTALLLTIVLFLFPFLGERFPISWLTFLAGIIGGFVSIQQRLKLLSDDELRHLSESWLNIVMVPVFGGIFALVLYLLMLSGILEGELFPTFSIPDTGYPLE